MNKYKLLLFDLDGTLCDTDEMIVQTMYAIYQDYKPVKIRTREELYYFSGPPIRETLKNECPDRDQDEMYDVFKRVSKQFYAPYVKAYPDEVEVLKTLKEQGYVLGVVTNKGLPLTKNRRNREHTAPFSLSKDVMTIFCPRGEFLTDTIA